MATMLNRANRATGYATYADLQNTESTPSSTPGGPVSAPSAVTPARSRETYQTPSYDARPVQSSSSSSPQHHSSANNRNHHMSMPPPALVHQIPSSMTEWRQLRERFPLMVLYIWKDSCLPCLKVKPAFERMAAELYRQFPTQALCVKDQIDDAHRLGEESPSFVHWKMCHAVPFFIIYENGQIRHKLTGFDEKQLRSFIQQSVTDLNRQGRLFAEN